MQMILPSARDTDSSGPRRLNSRTADRAPDAGACARDERFLTAQWPVLCTSRFLGTLHDEPPALRLPRVRVRTIEATLRFGWQYAARRESFRRHAARGARISRAPRVP